MCKECVYCGKEYIDEKIKCEECGGMMKMKRNVKVKDEFVYEVDGEKYNNVDNLLESKRKKSK